jgi:hypothetical protein
MTGIWWRYDRNWWYHEYIIGFDGQSAMNAVTVWFIFINLWEFGTRETKSVPTKKTHESYTVITRTDHNLPPVPSHDGFVTHGRMVYSFCRYRSIYMYMYINVYISSCCRASVFKVFWFVRFVPGRYILPVLKYWRIRQRSALGTRHSSTGLHPTEKVESRERKIAHTWYNFPKCYKCRVDLSFNRNKKQEAAELTNTFTIRLSFAAKSMYHLPSVSVDQGISSRIEHR